MRKIGLLLTLLLVFAVGMVAMTACDGDESQPQPEPQPSYFTVTFDSAGGSVVAPETVAEGSTVSMPDAPTRNGFVFSHWVQAGGDTAFEFSTPVLSNLALTAVWNQEFTVTFDSAGGSVVAPQTIIDGGTASKPDEPMRDGYTFIRWSAQGSTAEFDFSTYITANITLVAVWNRIYHRVTFDLGLDVEDADGESIFYYTYVAQGSFAVPPANPDDFEVVDFTPVAVVIVIDRSGSMNEIDPGAQGRTRIDIAREAAMAAVYALNDWDYVAIVSFAHWAQVDVPLVSLNGTNRLRVNNAIRAIMAAGGTEYSPALAMAELVLGGARDIDTRHIMFITDGEPLDIGGLPASFPALDRLYDAGISLSAIGIVNPDLPESSRTLQIMVERVGGRGRYFFGCVTLLMDFVQEDVSLLHQTVRIEFLHWTLADSYGNPVDADVQFLFETTPITAPIRLIAVWDRKDIDG